jgi:hypothetical protein
MSLHLAVAGGFVVTLNFALVVAARAVARTVTSRAERGRDQLGEELRARLEDYVDGRGEAHVVRLGAVAGRR